MGRVAAQRLVLSGRGARAHRRAWSAQREVRAELYSFRVAEDVCHRDGPERGTRGGGGGRTITGGPASVERAHADGRGVLRANRDADGISQWQGLSMARPRNGKARRGGRNRANGVDRGRTTPPAGHDEGAPVRPECVARRRRLRSEATTARPGARRLVDPGQAGRGPALHPQVRDRAGLHEDWLPIATDRASPGGPVRGAPSAGMARVSQRSLG